ncbi:hypothetical protein CP556_22565 [Natrinema sp. CBA1119]|uniref:hypothetical protein n=1 Tax=Natrinema sp. CBA1119 TaxID=1608465 RepID=UPI000BF96CE7|nr:hypothetical protein [Natrinema sp. CBA1119]PGF14275.1 hypothetical protein CP556_22565 [Natrinema sp. CBA1119]
MSPRLTLEPVDTVPSDSQVCHYDELSEDAKEELPLLTVSDDVCVDGSIANGFQNCDLVKYTDYYEVSVV